MAISAMIFRLKPQLAGTYYFRHVAKCPHGNQQAWNAAHNGLNKA